MKIEPLSRLNAAYLVGLCEELHGLGSLAAVPFDWNFTQNTILSALNDINYYVQLCRTDSGVYAGFVAGHVEQFLFSSKYLAVEDAWYVREGTPERTKMAIALMRGFMKWSLQTRNAVMIQSGDIANINATAVDGIYRHIGFKRYGVIYKYAEGLN